MICRRRRLPDSSGCGSLKRKRSSLGRRREYLTKGGVFTDELIDAYIELKGRLEEIKVRTFVHRWE